MTVEDIQNRVKAIDVSDDEAAHSDVLLAYKIGHHIGKSVTKALFALLFSLSCFAAVQFDVVNQIFPSGPIPGYPNIYGVERIQLSSPDGASWRLLMDENYGVNLSGPIEGIVDSQIDTFLVEVNLDSLDYYLDNGAWTFGRRFGCNGTNCSLYEIADSFAVPQPPVPPMEPPTVPPIPPPYIRPPLPPVQNTPEPSFLIPLVAMLAVIAWRKQRRKDA